jgi:hypothetical protein
MKKPQTTRYFDLVVERKDVSPPLPTGLRIERKASLEHLLARPSRKSRSALPPFKGYGALFRENAFRESSL